MRIVKFLDIIRSIGGYLRVDNLAGYKETYTIVDLGPNDFVPLDVMLNNTPTLPSPYIYNIPAGSETPILIDFDNDTIQYGDDSPIELPTSLADYKANPDVKFKLIIDSENSRPIGNEGWITNEEWATADSYATMKVLTLEPDNNEDPDNPGTYITLDNINIIIKP